VKYILIYIYVLYKKNFIFFLKFNRLRQQLQAKATEERGDAGRWDAGRCPLPMGAGYRGKPLSFLHSRIFGEKGGGSFSEPSFIRGKKRGGAGCKFGTDPGVQDRYFLLLGWCNHIVFDSIPMVPHVPRDVKLLQNKLLDPLFARVIQIQTGVVSLLNVFPLLRHMPPKERGAI
jgi:hypothetical protein